VCIVNVFVFVACFCSQVTEYGKQPYPVGHPGHGLVILPVPREQNEFIEQHGLKKLGLQAVFKISNEKTVRKKHLNNL
jgi:hypothetical protein